MPPIGYFIYHKTCQICGRLTHRDNLVFINCYYLHKNRNDCRLHLKVNNKKINWTREGF